MRLNRAIDVWIGELARKKKSKRTRADYQRDLFNFADRVDPHGERDIGEITEEDCWKYLNDYVDQAASTMGSKISILKGFFRFFDKRGYLPNGNPATNIDRPTRPLPEDLDVVEAKQDDVVKIIGACQTWQELICIGAAAYIARRRTALANARRRDADLDEGVIRFVDKGNKVIYQPVPFEFLEVLRAADRHGVWDGPSDWLIPPRRKLTTGTDKRESKVIYETLVKVAIRAGVRRKEDKRGIHVHSLRAAFAVQFLEQKRDEQQDEKQHEGDRLLSLKELLGHSRVETTMIYLRRRNRARAMDQVRGLSWGGIPAYSHPEGAQITDLQAKKGTKAHTGFEPVLDESTEGSSETAPRSPVGEKLDELRAQQQQPPKRKHRRTSERRG